MQGPTMKAEVETGPGDSAILALTQSHPKSDWILRRYCRKPAYSNCTALSGAAGMAKARTYVGSKWILVRYRSYVQPI